MVEEIKNYLEKWDTLDNYVLQESSLSKLFTQTYPLNNMDDVLIKVCALNDFYSTNIFSPLTIAKHIVELKIDQRLKNEDLELVNDIAKVWVNRTKIMIFIFISNNYTVRVFF